MHGDRIYRGLAIPFIALASMASVCGTGTGPTSIHAGQNVSKQVRLVNTESEAVHLFKENESFPCCQVEAGGAREVTVTWFDRINDDTDNTFTHEFRAGRNGAIVSTRACTVTAVGGQATVLRVVFEGGALACSGW